jgi:diguanylate cyclase (GGDEF)-like protein
MTVDARPTVLIVDDDRVNRLMLAELLQGECRVILAKDGPSALARARTEAELSLILLDVAMPQMNGYDVLRQLQADIHTADIPVVFITAQTDQEDEERGLLLGAVDYVVKPVRPAIVRARIRNHLRLTAQRKELARLAARDSLTGIANRRHFDEAFLLACRLAQRAGEPLHVAMIDVDCFKQYNDHYGHGAGDEALRQIAAVIAGFARRPYDVAARYGGEEFVLLLPGPIDFPLLLEKLRHAVLALALPHDAGSVTNVVSISIGAASRLDDADPGAFLQRADAMLYEAKRRGRNRIVIDTSDVVLADQWGMG